MISTLDAIACRNPTLAAVLFFSTVPCFSQRTITTVAGTDPVLTGEEELAGNVTLGRIRDVTVDRNGVVYFTDQDFAIVGRLGPGWTLQIVAGTGRKGFAGDGGPARMALLSDPAGLVTDAAGNIYVADNQTQFGAPRQGRVRRISPDGTIQTIAGGGSDRAGENIFATDAYLDSLGGLAIDKSGALILADTGSGRVRRVSSDGRIQTIAGNGVRSFGPPPVSSGNDDDMPATEVSVTPVDVAVDLDGSILVTDITGPGRIRRITAEGLITTVAGGPPPFAGPPPANYIDLSQPTGLAVSPNGTIYVFAEFGLYAISADKRMTQISGDVADPFINDGQANQSSFRSTWFDLNGLAFDADGNLYVADTGNYKLRRIDIAGVVHTFAGTGVYRREGENWPAAVSYLNSPTRLAIGSAGQTYVIDRENCRIREIAPNGLIRTVVGNGSCWTVLGSEGLQDGTRATLFGLGGVTDIAADNRGNLFIANGSQIFRLSSDGLLHPVVNRLGRSGPSVAAGTSAVDAILFGPLFGIALDGAGNLYFTEASTNRVYRVSQDGALALIAGPATGGPGPGGFAGDGGLAVDARFGGVGDIASDSQGNLYIVDFGNSRIRKVTTDGRISTIAGTGKRDLMQPGGQATDSAILLEFWTQIAVDDRGEVLFTSAPSNRVWRIRTSGELAVEAGSGTPGFSGDGRTATDAMLTTPMGVAVAANGTVWVSDTGNNRIRQITRQ